MALTLLITNLGIDRKSRLMLNKGVTLSNLAAILYVNNHVPAVTDTTGSFTTCSAPGYVNVTLTGASWTGSTSGGVATYNYPTISFTMTGSGGGQTIYGIYLSDSLGDAVAAALLSTPFVLPSGGGTVTIDLQWVDQQCP